MKKLKSRNKIKNRATYASTLGNETAQYQVHERQISYGYFYILN